MILTWEMKKSLQAQTSNKTLRKFGSGTPNSEKLSQRAQQTFHIKPWLIYRFSADSLISSLQWSLRMWTDIISIPCWKLQRKLQLLQILLVLQLLKRQTITLLKLQIQEKCQIPVEIRKSLMTSKDLYLLPQNQFPILLKIFMRLMEMSDICAAAMMHQINHMNVQKLIVLKQKPMCPDVQVADILLGKGVQLFSILISILDHI